MWDANSGRPSLGRSVGPRHARMLFSPGSESRAALPVAVRVHSWLGHSSASGPACWGWCGFRAARWSARGASTQTRTRPQVLRCPSMPKWPLFTLNGQRLMGSPSPVVGRLTSRSGAGSGRCVAGSYQHERHRATGVFLAGDRKGSLSHRRRQRVRRGYRGPAHGLPPHRHWPKWLPRR